MNNCQWFKIQDYFIISSEKLKCSWTLATSHIVMLTNLKKSVLQELAFPGYNSHRYGAWSRLKEHDPP